MKQTLFVFSRLHWNEHRMEANERESISMQFFPSHEPLSYASPRPNVSIYEKGQRQQMTSYIECWRRIQKASAAFVKPLRLFLLILRSLFDLLPALVSHQQSDNHVLLIQDIYSTRFPCWRGPGLVPNLGFSWRHTQLEGVTYPDIHQGVSPIHRIGLTSQR